MMQQYDKLKEKHKDAILLFRLGDFYEAFNDDAKKISKILNITLTGRGSGENRRPMAGIPHHALKNYLKKLVDAGEKVAIAEQVEAPQAGKIVKREVAKIITAGTISDLDFLDESKNNYIGAVYQNSKKKYFFAFSDLTTGEFKSSRFDDLKELLNEIFRLNINELLIPERLSSIFYNKLKNKSFQTVEDFLWNIDEACNILKNHFGVSNFKGFGYEDYDEELIPLGIILDYLKQTQKSSLEHIKSIKKYNLTSFMNLDPTTINSLELLWPISNENKKGTLFAVLNQCQTPMGQRLLRNWLIHPLKEKKQIEQRLDAVEEISKNAEKISQIRDILDNICDIERVVSKIGTNSINARDLLALKIALEKFLNLKQIVKEFKSNLINFQIISSVNKNQELITEIIDLIENSIVNDPPITITEGGMLKPGFNKELDEIRQIMQTGKNWIKTFQKKEIERTGITSLKVKFNNVFGYYIEVSKTNLSKVPDDYIRKQTLVNAERFITQELKEWEDKIVNAESRANQLEYELFNEIKSKVADGIEVFLTIANLVSVLDVITNFAHIARMFDYSKPEINEDQKFEVIAGRHPVVERFIDENYIPNDLFLDKDTRIIILTGPNMSGKSTYIRQIALISLMAQIGSFVPAKSANLSVVDRIFTRVGASDNLAHGQSTFMVEMSETANILNNATENSLIILDEIGRGTSTYDGVAIAWSIVEYIHEYIGAKTLFATHYHELIDLEDKLDGVENYNVKVLEEGDEVIFTRKVEKGATDQSYGVYVAQMAGVPKEVIKRAKSILMTLEQESMLDVRSIETELIEQIKSNKLTRKQKEKKSKITKNNLSSKKSGQLGLL